MAIEIISLIISIFALGISVYIWYSDKKQVWFWNIVIVPIQDIFKKMKDINIKKPKEVILEFNRYQRNIKNVISFLEISVKDKKIKDIEDYIENQFNKINLTIISEVDSGNYLELISTFEVQLYKKIAKLVLIK